MHTIYLIRNRNTGKIYVGQTSKQVNIRWNQHRTDLRTSRHKNKHLQHSWDKYGANAFEFFVLDVLETKSEADDAERALKKWFDELDLCYNICDGGEGRTGPMSEEAKRKISETTRGRRCLNLESFHSSKARAKAQQSNKGKKRDPAMFTKEWREKQRLAHLGKPSGMKGKKHTEENAATLRVAQLGKSPPNKGKPMPPDVKERWYQARWGNKKNSEIQSWPA